MTFDPGACPYPCAVGFSRRFRRRNRDRPSRPWRRTFTYREEKIPSYARVIVPISSDAPYEQRDARFWNRVLLVLIVLLVIAGVVIVFAR